MNNSAIYCSGCDEHEPLDGGGNCKYCGRFICADCLEVDSTRPIDGPVCSDCVSEDDLTNLTKETYQMIELTAAQVRELAELIGFTISDDSGVDDWLPDNSKVTITQFAKPTEVKYEDGEIAGKWSTIVTFDEAPENGANPLGRSNT